MQRFDQAYIDKVVGSYGVPSKLSTNDAWEKLQKRIDEKPAYKSPKVVRINFWLGTVAASLVFLFVLYMGMFKIGRFSPEIKTATLQNEKVYLPDSSMLVVNSNSCAKYHYNKFTGNRNIQINGEVFFDVRKGKSFSVDFKGGNVSVLGTKFNVVAYSPNYLHLECYEGSVVFKRNRNEYILKAGEGMIAFNDSVSEIYTLDKTSFYDKLNGIYYWDKISLGELANFIEMRFNYRVDIDNSIAQRNFSGKIDLADLNNGLNIVSYAMDLIYTVNHEENIITFNAKKSGSHI
ncbi:MAG TPA: FecR family protein [Prolixibacteraceae bacterium]|nr:FecR family protein [Prolixibacteraceae bacterium]HPR61840.1 FecR family protein [Prolixibacteraceae bacterium]